MMTILVWALSGFAVANGLLALSCAEKFIRDGRGLPAFACAAMATGTFVAAVMFVGAL